MPSRRRGGDLVLFNSEDPEPLVRWLIDNYGLQPILQFVAQYQPGGETPAKRAYKRRGPKKGSKRGGKKVSKKRGRKSTGPGGAGETGNG